MNSAALHHPRRLHGRAHRASGGDIYYRIADSIISMEKIDQWCEDTSFKIEREPVWEMKNYHRSKHDALQEDPTILFWFTDNVEKTLFMMYFDIQI